MPSPLKILLQFCVALMGALLLVLIGIQPEDGENWCTIASALLHYFLLSSFLWMLMEGINMYIQLVRVIHPGRNFSIVKWSAIIAWGMCLPFDLFTFSIVSGPQMAHLHNFSTTCCSILQFGKLFVLLAFFHSDEVCISLS